MCRATHLQGQECQVDPHKNQVDPIFRSFILWVTHHIVCAEDVNVGRTGHELDDDRKGEPQVGEGEPGECEVESTRVSGADTIAPHGKRTGCTTERSAARTQQQRSRKNPPELGGGRRTSCILSVDAGSQSRVYPPDRTMTASIQSEEVDQRVLHPSVRFTRLRLTMEAAKEPLDHLLRWLISSAACSGTSVSALLGLT
jgi:hypothetical protein